MDHLYDLFEDPGQCDLASLRVPFLCQDEYPPDCPFSQYPQRMGCDKHRFLALDFNQYGPTETAAFLQSWLYFGLLASVMRIPIVMGDFIGEDQGVRVVTTRTLLPKCLEAWATKIKAKDVEQMEADLEEARSYVHSILRAGPSCPLPPQVTLSIMVLGPTLTRVIDQKVERFPPKSTTLLSDWGMSPILTARFLDRGWCINDVHRLCSTVSVPSALVASSIQRHEVIPREKHAACTPATCIARTIDEATYRTKHVEPGCQCETVPSPIDKVSAILESGQIPVVVMKTSPSSNGTVELDVHPGNKVRFVAISHVWADGLGCAAANSLPRCQLLRLQTLCADLYPTRPTGGLRFLKKSDSPIGLWIDTLCVPREKTYRRLAISRMSSTYADADKVLVLDSELLSLSGSLPDRMILFRVLGSSWMRRVWTMQEGALGARGLHLRLADRALNVSDVAARLSSSSAGPLATTSLADRDATIFLQEFDQLRKAHSKSYWRDGVPAMAASMRILNGRSTTKEGDAYICLAGMMALESSVIKDLDATPVEERTRKLLAGVRYLPKNIIFSPGPKLQEEGFRWACASFWKSQFTFHDSNEVGEVSDDGLGLRVEFQGFELDGPIHLPKDCLLFQSVHTNTWYKATYDSASQFSGRTTGQAQAFGIICPQREVVRHGPGGSQIPAALVSIPPRKSSLRQKFGRDANAIPCAYLCQVVLSTPTPVDFERQTTRATARRPNNTQEPRRIGVVYTPQIWYIS